MADLISDSSDDDHRTDATTKAPRAATRSRGNKFSVSREELEGTTGDDFPTSRYKGARQRLAAARTRGGPASSGGAKANELRRVVAEDRQGLGGELLLTLEDSDHFKGKGRLVSEKKSTTPAFRGSIKAKDSILAEEKAAEAEARAARRNQLLDDDVLVDYYDYDLLTLPTSGYDSASHSGQPADQTSNEDTRNESIVDVDAELNDVVGSDEVGVCPARPGLC